MKTKRLLAMLTTIAVLFGLFGGMISAGAVTLHSGDPSKDGYVSMHQYVSPTNDPTIVKITHTITANIKKPAVFVSFVLDGSGSMDATEDVYDMATDSGSFITRRTAVMRSMQKAVDTLMASKDVDPMRVFVNVIVECQTSGATAYGAVKSSQAGADAFSFTYYEAEDGTGGSALAPSGTGHFEGFVPLITDRNATTANPDLVNAIEAYGRDGHSDSKMTDGFPEAYRSLKEALLRGSGDPLGTKAWSNGTIDHMIDIDLETASRYIMVLGDGDPYVENQLHMASNKLQAAKSTPTLTSGLLDPASTGYFGETHALGATVWSSVFGSNGGHRLDWATKIVDFAWFTSHWDGIVGSAIPGVYSPNAGGIAQNYRVVEPYMISATVDVDPADPALVGGGYTSAQEGAKWAIADAVGALNGKTINNGFNKSNNSHYFWVQHVGGDIATSVNPGTTAGAPVLINTERQTLGSSDGEDVFKRFIDAATSTDTYDIKGTLSQGFEITQVSGKPLYELSSSDGAPGTATVSGTSVDWKPALVAGVEYKLSYYVKMDSAFDPSMFYNMINLGLYVNGKEEMTFEDVYATNPLGETKPGEEVEVAAKPGEETKEVVTRKIKAMVGSNTAVVNAKADVSKISTGVNKKTGRTFVKVDVKNNGDFKYQWQYLDADGKWVDVFGANGSVYYLGFPLKVGQTYQLRCVVSNMANVKFVSESIEAKRTKTITVKDEALSSKK